jgi:hypothetical protein
MIYGFVEVDSTVGVIYDGVDRCMCDNIDTLYQDISPGSRGVIEQ